jgi:hypothetical protein
MAMSTVAAVTCRQHSDAACSLRVTDLHHHSFLQDQKDQLHFYVSAAQRALLNPDTPADIFARDADKTASEALSKSGSNGSNGSFENVNPSTYQEALLATDALKFTRNVVVLEITGADVNLSLIDLPGIIQTEQGDDGSNVKLVKELVEQYISSDRAIIVATITCKDDIDNQVRIPAWPERLSTK